MKKRLLLTLLTLCLAVVATMVVCADDAVSLGNVSLVSGNYYYVDSNGDILSNGSTVPTGVEGYALFKDSTLYLYDFEWSSDDNRYFVNAQADLTISLNGTSTISVNKDYSRVIFVEGDLTITGTGTLNIETESEADAYAIRCNGNITISGGCTVNAVVTSIPDNSTASSNAIYTEVGSITIINSKVTAKATSPDCSMSVSQAIFSNGMTITNSEVNAETSAAGDLSFAFSICSLGDIAIDENSTVTATATSDGYYSSEAYAIYSYGDMTITDSTITSAEASTDGNPSKAYAVYSYSGDIAISNSTISSASATADGDNTYAYSIYSSGDISIDENGAVTVNANSNGSQYSESYGVYVANSISIASSEIYVTVNASGETGDLVAISASSVTIEQSGVVATVTSTGTIGMPAGIKADSDIVVENSALEIFVSSSYSQGELWGLITPSGYISIISSEFITDSGVYTRKGVTVTANAGELLCVEAGSDASSIDETLTVYVDESGVSLSSGVLACNYISISQHEHTYDSTSIVWSWASDYSTATATVTCADCGTVLTVEAVVTSEVDGSGNTVYTATIAGTTYTDTQTVAAAPTTPDEPTTSSKSDIYTTLSRIQASYTGVQAAIAKANALNPDDYENFSAVTEAIEAVDWSLNVLNQKQVNAYAEAIEEAIENLIPVSTTEEVIEIDEPVEAGETDSE